MRPDKNIYYDVNSKRPFTPPTRLDRVKRLANEHLVENILIKGKPTLISGAGGSNKSSLSKLLAKQVTDMGLAIVINTKEEDIEEDISVGIDAYGINSELVYVSNAINNFKNDFYKLEQTIDCVYQDGYDIGLVINDTDIAYMGGANSNDSGQTQEAFENLFMLAKQKKFSVLDIHHNNKYGQSMIDSIGGSMAFVNQHRVNYSLFVDPRDRNKRILAFVKANRVKWQPCQGFEVVEKVVKTENANPRYKTDVFPVLMPTGEDFGDVHGDDYFNPERFERLQGNNDMQQARTTFVTHAQKEAASYILRELTEEWTPSKEFKDKAVDAGVSEEMYDRVSSELRKRNIIQLDRKDGGRRRLTGLSFDVFND